MSARPQPLVACPQSALARVRGVMTDIDDTLTTQGVIAPAALHGLHALRAAGVPVVAITGRPLGWSRPFALAWPVDAIVAENGAVALIADRATGELATHFVQPVEVRLRNAARLAAVAARIVREVPGAAQSSDSAGRATDIAIDHAEHAQLGAARIEQVVALMRGEGLTATVSSIHINGWIGAHSKLSAAHWMVQRLFGRVLNDELDAWAYVGDSTNDQALFAAFPLSVGVANVLDFAHSLQHWPAYITQQPRGAGFGELAQAVLAARAGAAAQGTSRQHDASVRRL